MGAYGRGGGGSNSAASTYNQSKVLSSTPADLIVVLYERLLADLKGGAIAMRNRDLKAKADKLASATDIIFELLSSLDRSQGGEVAERLAALYAYMISRIGEASRTLDPKGIEQVAENVESLLSSWRLVAEREKAEGPAPPTQPR